MSTQHDTQLPHLLQKRTGRLCWKSRKKNLRFYKIYKFEKLGLPRSEPADPGRGTCFFLSTGECAQRGERSPSAAAPQFPSRESCDQQCSSAVNQGGDQVASEPTLYVSLYSVLRVCVMKVRSPRHASLQSSQLGTGCC